jgi:tetratricopeptide (TPR) repeat protein
MASAFDDFLDAAWNDHADDAPAVAERLAQSLDMIVAAEQVAPYAHIATHVYGEHLARHADGIALLERLRTHPAADGSPAAAGAVARGIAVLRYCSGDASGLDPLAADERIVVLATAASAFAEQKAYKRAIETYAEALALARGGIADGSPALRSLAVGGNNLAAVLEDKADRDALETRGMLAAAQAGLDYWRRAGTWLEEERAEFRLSSSRRSAGDYDGAIHHAQRCLTLCGANDAPPLEHFFGFAALALAQRSAGLADEFDASRRLARAWQERVDPSERTWCDTTVPMLADDAVDAR